MSENSREMEVVERELQELEVCLQTNILLRHQHLFLTLYKLFSSPC